HAQCLIAFADGVDLYAKCPQVEQVVESQLFLAHLAPDAVNVFGATVNLRSDACACQCCGQLGLQLLDVFFPFFASCSQLLGDAVIACRFQDAQAQVFQFPFQAG